MDNLIERGGWPEQDEWCFKTEWAITFHLFPPSLPSLSVFSFIPLVLSSLKFHIGPSVSSLFARGIRFSRFQIANRSILRLCENLSTFLRSVE